MMIRRGAHPSKLELTKMSMDAITTTSPLGGAIMCSFMTNCHSLLVTTKPDLFRTSFFLEFFILREASLRRLSFALFIGL